MQHGGFCQSLVGGLYSAGIARKVVSRKSIKWSVRTLPEFVKPFHALTQSDIPAKGIRVINPSEQNAIISRNDPGITISAGHPVDETVEDAFENGLFSMSEIVFDTERRHALVSYGFHCGMLCGNRAIWAFE